MPPRQTSSRTSSRIALRKYFAIAEPNGFGGSWP